MISKRIILDMHQLSLWASGMSYSLYCGRRLSSNVDIRFRDTVSSVGVLVSRHFPWIIYNSNIKTFRHALSLDEVSLHASVEMPIQLRPAASSEVQTEPLSSLHLSSKQVHKSFI